MNDTEALLSIGAFARRVRLAPSALRFYDDCGVLHPASVDDTTGYRYYHPAQEQRAVLVRRLRAAGVPLTEAGLVLDGTREEARAVLQRHVARARETAAAAQAAAEEILRGLEDGQGTVVTARVGGAELAGAVRQVAPSVAAAAAREEFPALGCVLLELDGDAREVRLVATDRYRLSVRTLHPHSVDGGSRLCRRLLVRVEDMRDLASWALPFDEVAIRVDAQGDARIHAGRETRPLPAGDATYPDYRMVLDALPPPAHRVITDRNAFRALLAETTTPGPVTLHTAQGRLRISRSGHPGESAHPALCTGPPLRIAFDPEVLLAALDAGVGPDVLLEISSTTGPVVVRSADQGSFTTLVMPARDTAREA